MQKLLFKSALTAFLLLSAVPFLSAQYHTVFKTNPLSLLLGKANLTYEHVLDDQASLIGEISYRYRLFGEDVTSLGLGAGYRYYFTHEQRPAPEGFYGQPQLGLTFGRVADEGSFVIAQLGAEAGYQWVWPSNFVLDLGLGFNFGRLSGRAEDYSFAKGRLWLPLPSLTLAVGYAF